MAISNITAAKILHPSRIVQGKRQAHDRIWTFYADHRDSAAVMNTDSMMAPRASPQSLTRALQDIVGRRHVLTGPARTSRFTTGYRWGGGPALAVVRPGTLVEIWRVLSVCVDARAIVIMQSANTGLTGGSTPHGTYDRHVIVINTLRIKGIHLINGGQQVVCLPGTTLHELETLLQPLGRDPHSVIGSSCIGASVLGGICNNSGGALIQRGPAYTEMALFAQVGNDGQLRLVNHLGITLGEEPEEILRRVEAGTFGPDDIELSDDRRASDRDYSDHVRKIDEHTPARFNADQARLYEASGSAGRVALLAARLDTFPKDAATATFYIGSSSVSDLAQLRRDVLRDFNALPISGEYFHREAFDVAALYGKDMVIAIERLGTARLPLLFSLKSRIDELVRKLPVLPEHLSDRLLQLAGRLFADHLPQRMRQYRDRFAHHLVLKMGGTGISEAQQYLERRYPNQAGDFFQCTEAEAAKAFLHRFAIAGAAMRYRALHGREVEDIISLDVALRRNDAEWFEQLPVPLDDKFVKKIYYGHFFCHVFHQDYVLAKGADAAAVKRQLLDILDDRGAEYPAEHNVGHLYEAKPTLMEHYRALDPTNHFNPGLGGTSRREHWG
ncbi:D-lactate dehydrogenase [Sphingosinicella xenopeptidilytica]|uniref:Quinone-dependent D-lactate dehydrogenase n=1 Tax=Sphingosinicella xenopeptidilytica TaxID=364098 RepID=A0ABW3C4E3_SPHXN